MFILFGLFFSFIAYFITNEGFNAVISIMVCSVFLTFIFEKTSNSSTVNSGTSTPSTFSEHISIKYGHFRESVKERRKLNNEEIMKLTDELNKNNEMAKRLSSDSWLEEVKNHLKKVKSIKGDNSDINYSMTFYQELRCHLMKENEIVVNNIKNRLKR
ncbi:hypothetical protein C9426_24095 [Serratia sp. S1B]|nr:hypothetical protein C9426_24095 [Serratia sp. S1B]